MAKKIYFNIQNFPEDLKERAQIRAIKEKTTLRALMLKALVEYLNKGEKE